MIHAIRLGAVLYCVWLLLSGHLSPLLLTLGLVSALCATAMAFRMEIVDLKPRPVRLRWAFVRYWLWLGKEIVKSNLQVARCILTPTLPISPRLMRVRASQRSAFGIVTYANGITLTPGTVAIAIEGDTIEVHALTDSAARALEDGQMDALVSAVEGVP